MGELLSLEIEAGDAGYIVRLAGEIDLETAPKVRDELAALTGDLVVDLTDVTFVDSQTIGLLISEHKRRVAAGERLVVTGSSPMALRAFQICGVDRVLDLDGDAAPA